MSIDLVSNDLKQDISRKLNKKIDELNEKDLLEIKRIILKSTDIYENDTDCNIKDLEKLKNLINCSIFNFIITEEEIKNIKQIKKLKTLQFDNCSIESKTLKFNKNIENLFIHNCSLTENIEISGRGLKSINILGNHETTEKEIDISLFKNIESLENLEIHYYKIIGLNNIIKKTPNLKKLNIDGSITEENILKLSRRIEISQNKLYHLN